MTNRIKAILTALLIMALMSGSAMCTPTELPDRAATQAELKAIEVLQKTIDERGYNWTAGITSVSRLTDDEKKKLCGVKPTKDQKDKDVKEKKPHPKKHDPVGTYPSTFDWRGVDGVDWMTPVRNQGSCGSCWAFSAIGAVEARINIQANNSDVGVDLSEQHLVSSCCYAGDCGGGYPSEALKYIKYTGVPEEACFPYIGGDCGCTPCANWDNNAWSIVAYIPIDYQSEYKDAISSYGPISATIYVYDDFFSYTGGVYNRTSNDYKGLHAITVVGWNDTEGCWIIKNSWGIGWGEDGYGRLPETSFKSHAAYSVVEIGDYVPRAEASANVTNGTAPLTVAFIGTGIDYDGTIVSYDWDFGDGASSTSQNPTHTYTDLGMYTATLTVTDDDGNMGFDSVVVINGETITPIVASASSSITDDFLPGNAIDGDLETYWLSNVYCYPNWITFDFGEQVALHSVCMSMPGHDYSVFDVLVSDDATSWDVVYVDMSVSNSSMAEVVVNTSSARYVKLAFDDLNGVEGCSEFYAILPLPVDPCVVYDTNNNCYIEMSELAVAIDDWQAGTLEMSDLATLIGYWQSGESYCE